MHKKIKAQDIALAKQQKAAYNRILRLLQASKAQVLEAILSSEGFSQDLMLNTLYNIDILMLQLRQDLAEKYQFIIKEASDIGVQHQLELVKEIAAVRMTKEALFQLIGPVEVTVLTQLETNMNTYLDRFAASIRERVKNTIQQSFIHGRNETDTMRIINQQYGTEISTTQRAVHHIYQSAYNAANHEVLVELEKTIPGLKKEWYSMLDKKTTEPCQNLHGQIKLVQEPFIEPASGSLFRYPPAVFGNEDLHPKFHFCRSRAIPSI